MTYQETIDYLYSKVPVYQHIGQEAYKPGLGRMQALDAFYGSPHQAYKTIHVGGTNGKGSVSHTLAAILQSAGYKVGLFTSPHLLDFRERIRVNGEVIVQDYVCEFTAKAKGIIERYQPSFFELTTMMAFCYFAEQKVDIAVIEVGLGGRLDSTNIISPICSVVTNVSFDHTQFLGDNLLLIAGEKAGIIKPHVPIIVGSARDKEVRNTFRKRAQELEAPIFFADEHNSIKHCYREGTNLCYQTDEGLIVAQLSAEVQKENTLTVLAVLKLLREELAISFEAIQEGFAYVVELTGLQGRWQQLRQNPKLICDTAHNEAGIRSLLPQIEEEARRAGGRVFFVLGMAKDKDVEAVLSLLPKHYKYYFTVSSGGRALPAWELLVLAQRFGLSGVCCTDVSQAMIRVLFEAKADDFIFVGGSNFVVADLLTIIG